MGDSLHSQDGYPPGVSNSDPHFHEGTYEGDECPHCGCPCDGTTEDCPRCGRVLDEDSYPDRER